MEQACNILVPTERSEAWQITKPGIQHSWISGLCGDLIAWPPTAPCQIPSSRPDTPESNIRLHREILRQEWVTGYWAVVWSALQTQELCSDWIRLANKPYHREETCHFWQPYNSVYTVTVHFMDTEILKSYHGDVISHIRKNVYHTKAEIHKFIACAIRNNHWLVLNVTKCHFTERNSELMSLYEVTNTYSDTLKSVKCNLDFFD